MMGIQVASPQFGTIFNFPKNKTLNNPHITYKLMEALRETEGLQVTRLDHGNITDSYHVLTKTGPENHVLQWTKAKELISDLRQALLDGNILPEHQANGWSNVAKLIAQDKITKGEWPSEIDLKTFIEEVGDFGFKDEKKRASDILSERLDRLNIKIPYNETEPANKQLQEIEAQTLIKVLKETLIDEHIMEPQQAKEWSVDANKLAQNQITKGNFPSVIDVKAFVKNSSEFAARLLFENI